MGRKASLVSVAWKPNSKMSVADMTVLCELLHVTPLWQEDRDELCKRVSLAYLTWKEQEEGKEKEKEQEKEKEKEKETEKEREREREKSEIASTSVAPRRCN